MRFREGKRRPRITQQIRTHALCLASCSSLHGALSNLISLFAWLPGSSEVRFPTVSGREPFWKGTHSYLGPLMCPTSCCVWSHRRSHLVHMACERDMNDSFLQMRTQVQRQNQLAQSHRACRRERQNSMLRPFASHMHALSSLVTGTCMPLSALGRWPSAMAVPSGQHCPSSALTLSVGSPLRRRGRRAWF